MHVLYLFQYTQSPVPVPRLVPTVEGKGILQLDRSLHDLLMTGELLNQVHHEVVRLDVPVGEEDGEEDLSIAETRVLIDPLPQEGQLLGAG